MKNKKKGYEIITSHHLHYFVRTILTINPHFKIHSLRIIRVNLMNFIKLDINLNIN
jgi:hypothetical protein